jgi:hypothetical protein
MPPPALRRLDAALVEGLGKAGQGRYTACLQALDTVADLVMNGRKEPVGALYELLSRR